MRDVIVEDQIYVIDEALISARRVQFRKGMKNIYSIRNESFVAYNHDAPGEHAYVNYQHGYLCARMAIVKVLFYNLYANTEIKWLHTSLQAIASEIRTHSHKKTGRVELAQFAYEHFEMDKAYNF